MRLNAFIALIVGAAVVVMLGLFSRVSALHGQQQDRRRGEVALGVRQPRHPSGTGAGGHHTPHPPRVRQHQPAPPPAALGRGHQPEAPHSAGQQRRHRVVEY
eukprot:Hpha_TRINITY_DN28118_c0_g1::TRINITY_DN28118_c0_g1_i1::g.103300::m.103300